jgi:hypothetical protein
VEDVAGVRVPDFAERQQSSAELIDTSDESTHAVKSALADAARAASGGHSLVLQTAPLWPRKVPIQSPVHSRSIGLPSLQEETRRYVLSSRIGEKARWVTGRVWPGATSGTAFGGADMSERSMRVVCYW